jgi:hypothetical protein
MSMVKKHACVSAESEADGRALVIALHRAAQRTPRERRHASERSAPRIGLIAVLARNTVGYAAAILARQPRQILPTLRLKMGRITRN